MEEDNFTPDCDNIKSNIKSFMDDMLKEDEYKLKNRETQISTRPFNRINILYIILASVLIGFVTVSLAVITKGFVHLPLIDPGINFNKLMHDFK